MLSALSQFIFGSRFSHNESGKKGLQWRERTLSFDSSQSEMHLANGEHLIGCFYPIQDIKGNPDELGVLKITNLRLIWICCDKKRVNLSIGWHTVLLTFQQNMRNSLGLPSSTLCVLTSFESTKYEFLFRRMTDMILDIFDFDDRESPFNDDKENLASGSHETNIFLHNLTKLTNNHQQWQITHLSPMNDPSLDPFDCVFKVWQAYKRTLLFRQFDTNLEINPAYKQLSPPVEQLPSEKILRSYDNTIQVEKSRQAMIGTLFVSNIRLIWINNEPSPALSSFKARNLSIPFLHIDSVKLKRSEKLVVCVHESTSTFSSVKNIEFKRKRTEPANKIGLEEVAKDLQALLAINKADPRIGPEVCSECIEMIEYLTPIHLYVARLGSFLSESDGKSLIEATHSLLNKARNAETQLKRVNMDDPEDDAFEKREEDFSSKVSNYTNTLKTHANDETSRQQIAAIYSEELGLTVECPMNGNSLPSIWQIIY